MAKIDKKTGKLIYDKITYSEVVQANYLASMKDDSHVDDSINFYTGLMPWNWGTIDASHTEIGFWIDDELWFCSSTSRPELGTAEENGTRWIKGSELLRHPDRWHLQVRQVEDRWGLVQRCGCLCKYFTADEIITAKIVRANKLMGKRYDFRGVLTDFTVPYRVFRKQQLTPEVIEKIKKIYCSKFVHAVDTGWLIVFSPKRRYKWAKKNGYESVEDTYEWLVARGVLNG